MLLTIISFQPELPSPSWNLLVWLQRSNGKARLTWRRLTPSHNSEIVQKPHKMFNQTSQDTTHIQQIQTILENLIKMPKITMTTFKYCPDLLNQS